MWLVVKPLAARYMRRKFQQKVNDMFRQAMGGNAGPTGSDPFETYHRNTRQQAEKPARRKVFSRDEGEYIEFEEVHIHAEYTSTDTTTSQSTSYTPREPQISDADWEEIN